MGFGIVLNVHCQIVELIGEGVRDEVNPVTLTFTDTGTIDSVRVEAAGIFRGTTPGTVLFNGEECMFTLAENDYAPTVDNGGSQNWGYYAKTFTSGFESGITLNKNEQGTQIVSFIAYIFREDGGPGIYNAVNYNHTFFFVNGSGDPYTYQFNIPPSGGDRDIEVLVPFSELTEDGRHVMGSLTAGTVSINFDFDSNNQGELLNIQDFVLPDVPGDVTEANLSIYSPIESIDGKKGDSFLTSSVLLTTTVDQGCTLTQGYWKTHSEYGPASKPDPTWNLLTNGPDTEFFLSGKTYIEVLNTQPKGGNAYYMLAHQYIAAELNMLAGAYWGDITDEFNEATTLLLSYTPANIGALKGNNPLRKDFEELAGTLDDFNNGTIGPGHCDEGYELSEKSAQINPEGAPLEITDFSVYPNPVLSHATISFTPVYDGTATIDLYNLMGQKTARLFSKNVSKDLPEHISVENGEFKEGTYILVIQNGPTTQSTKIDIKK